MIAQEPFRSRVKQMILILGLHSYYSLPDFDFLRIFAKKLLLKVENVFKLQFYNIDKLRNINPKNFAFGHEINEIDRQILG